MRGLWVATVRNIDWPSKDTLTADQQRAELIDILDRASTNGFNAIVFHVRPASDAVYESSLEPWGSMLTGHQGTDPGYDPLAFAIEQAHARGLELHAWINPFRAGNAKDTATLAPTHLFNARRDLVRVYGAQLWLDPGDTAVQEHVARVVADIVRRYDVDGIHADDYFYPYPEKDSSGRAIDFPDSATYVRSGSTLARDDWRRDNIDRFVERMYREVHQIKPAIKVGLSPFGIWRPGNPPSVAGFDAYASIYADSRKWLRSGWVDYLTPQLYWKISSPQQSFPALLDWWLGENVLGRPIWPGLATYRVNNGTASAFGRNEIADQIKLIRARPAPPGHIMFNTTTTLKRNNGAVLKTIVPLYAQRALVPPSPWLNGAVGGAAPPAPTITVTGRSLQIMPAASESPRWWYVRARSRGSWFRRSKWTSRIVFGNTTTITLDADLERVLVNAVDQSGNVSAAAEFWTRAR
jgi:uncharacterized lipoprotein YddW (UPF0748 family)